MHKTVAYYDIVTRVLSVVSPTNRVLLFKTLDVAPGTRVKEITDLLKAEGFTVGKRDKYPYGLQFDVI